VQSTTNTHIRTDGEPAVGESMPPQCKTLDGPVIKAINKALEKNNVNFTLPWVPERVRD